MPYQNQTLLQTKLHRPPITRSLIARPHLIEQLNSGINRPLTLVCAAAGYGKTTLVGSWLEGASSSQPAEANTLPAAWLSLDENDSNLQLFLQYFVAALRTIFTDACSETLALLHEMVQPPPIALYTTLNNEIEQLSGSFILVLDDYHTIHDVEVH